MADGPYCPECGAAQPTSAPSADPLIGQVLSGRYEIQELVSAGGMGRVYRALQRPLDRAVAVKVMDPSVVPAVNPEELAARFLTEARAASRLNHPNVISIYDFGQATTIPSAPLFLVMELLGGKTLAQLVDEGERFPPERVGAILSQTLAALAEAHAQGIVHRDIKPANIIVERIGDVERVKVIDFGVSRIVSERRLTEDGQIMGTPQYIAPELVLHQTMGPSVDLYAVGIVLFEILVGHVPFDSEAPAKILQLHMLAPRPDPQRVAPDRDVPRALADVCLRAMAIDPAERYPDARSLARAIEAAVLSTARDGAPEPRGARTASTNAVAPRGPTVPLETSETVARVRLAARVSSPGVQQMPLVGRDDHLAAARALLASRGEIAALLLYGAPGTGRTRLLAEIAQEAETAGALVVDVPSEPRARYEIGYTTLRALVGQLAGDALGPALDARDGSGLSLAVTTGLSRIFGGAEREESLAATQPSSSPGSSPSSGSRRGASGDARRDSVVQTIAWAAQLAASRARGAMVVVLIDDLDVVDGISRAAILDAVETGAAFAALFVASSESVPARLAIPSVQALEVVGLTRQEAKRLAAGGRASSPEVAKRSDSASSQRRVEPLFLEHYVATRAASPDARPPSTLNEMISARQAALPRDAMRVLLAIAVAGAVPVDDLSRLVPRLEGAVDAALVALSEKGFAHVAGGRARLTHEIYGTIALADAPAGVVEDLHAAMAASLASAGDAVELRAYHAMRGRAGDEATALVHRVARLRAARADDDGAIAALFDGFLASRRRAARGDWETAQQSFIGFGKRLAEVLSQAGKPDQAQGVALEVLGTMGPGSRGRAPLLELLARIASSRGKHGEAARWMRDAEIAVDEEDDSRASIRRIAAEATTGKRARPPGFGREERTTPSRTSGVVPYGKRADARVDDDDEGTHDG